jgi:hypothetical protein
LVYRLAGLVLEIEIAERLPGGVLHDEGFGVLFDRTPRREAGARPGMARRGNKVSVLREAMVWRMEALRAGYCGQR